ncbi:hypothetical protein [Desulfobotulus alkaliphilus]|uniref:hypothetical protein n=1 Tax=Desulfobotulus alkaliphilus TaxID=622671 RepID=UPI0011A668C9|nr:hypothetical protein [Desulfobotulus alkaliphilus]
MEYLAFCPLPDNPRKVKGGFRIDNGSILNPAILGSQAVCFTAMGADILHKGSLGYCRACLAACGFQNVSQSEPVLPV